MNQCKLNIGDVVLSKKGRDANNYFMVVSIENDDFVLVADGKKHVLAKPKKKNVKHIQIMNETVKAELLSQMQNRQPHIDDAIKYAIKQKMNFSKSEE